MAPAPVAIFDGQVASALARWNVTGTPGVHGKEIREQRSRPQGIADAQNALERMLHRRRREGVPIGEREAVAEFAPVRGSAAEVNAQDSAASGVGAGDPGSKVSRFW
ncbi:hypothetical protein SBADM41S_00239 [Streptomyces badius]